MIKYPILKQGTTIGVTAPSSGVPAELHHLIHKACGRLESKGYHVICGETVWTQEKARSAPARKRAAEFNKMMQEDEIQLIFPPWGGVLLVEILEYIDFNSMKPKWVLGYSDTSLLLLAITLNTGIATAHGTNLVDIRGETSDETTAKWEEVLNTKVNSSVLQKSSEKYQKEWEFDNPTPHIFNLTEPTMWKSVSGSNVTISGRLLGGCIDVIRHLIGTPYGQAAEFQRKYINNEPVLWFFENCELKTDDLRRTLVQMKLAGWFENSAGILFGRSSAITSAEEYSVEDVYQELYEELGIPIIFDIDCGHLPPQMTFVNGAYADAALINGKGTLLQHFI
ncbi:S66 family peptidase [Evansella clarkii]|uniref:S66 family peptidase n=1 Tax=Evansella clarkii TaxID=79879 RepID=UPI000998516C|nr:S66 peptidase family protein [Evansella clarkii]